MRIAILTSEAVPFAKTGGLADVSGALPKALQDQQIDARLFLPLYQQIDRRLVNGEPIDSIRVEWRGRVDHVRAWQSDAAGAPAYLIEAPEFFARDSIYGFSDDHIRFAFFSRAALALTKRSVCDRRVTSSRSVVHWFISLLICDLSRVCAQRNVERRISIFSSKAAYEIVASGLESTVAIAVPVT